MDRLCALNVENSSVNEPSCSRMNTKGINARVYELAREI